MRIRLRGETVDAKLTPILLLLTQEERQAIASMPDCEEPLPVSFGGGNVEASGDWPWPPDPGGEFPDWADFPQVRIGFKKRRFIITGLTSQDRMVRFWKRQKKFYEQPLLRACMNRTRKRKGAILDVGANLGNHTLFYASYCGRKPVYSVEAHPLIYQMLQFNVDHNVHPPDDGTVTTFNCAASSEDGTIGIHAVRPFNVGGTHVCPKQDESCEIEIPCHKLDTLFPELDVCLIKMDVEDHEPEALKGALGLLERCKPMLSLESHTQEALDAIAAVIGPLGYKLQGKAFAHNYFWSYQCDQ